MHLADLKYRDYGILIQTIYQLADDWIVANITWIQQPVIFRVCQAVLMLMDEWHQKVDTDLQSNDKDFYIYCYCVMVPNTGQWEDITASSYNFASLNL